MLFVPAISMSVAACAFVINLFQMNLTNKIGRAKLISDALQTFIDDDVMHTAFYKIEYNKFKYDGGFHDSNAEREIDKLLRHCSNLALLWEEGILTVRDMHPIQYFILRTVNDTEIQKYLSFIHHWSAQANTGVHPYSSSNKLATILNKGNVA